MTVKWICILVMLLCCFFVYPEDRFKFWQRYNDSDQSLIWVVNYTTSTLYCWIDDGYYDDFDVAPISRSDDYFEPNGNYEANCE